MKFQESPTHKARIHATQCHAIAIISNPSRPNH
jgi:hypothetical protein